MKPDPYARCPDQCHHDLSAGVLVTDLLGRRRLRKARRRLLRTGRRLARGSS